MGDYYSLRFKGTVNKTFRECFEIIGKEGRWDLHSCKPFQDFAKNDSRAGFIPNGSLSYAPDEWGDWNHATDGFENTYNKETGYWSFQCSVKTSCTVRKFFELLPLFIESIEHCEFMFETDVYSQKYELIDGKVVETNDKFIKYGHDYYEAPYMGH